jgi:predicted ABC-type ATPase
LTISKEVVTRPAILVLAGVNGAGKSSVGGALLAAYGLTWFNPDTYARALMAELNLDQEQANALAWQHGRNALEAAIADGTNYAFETTLGGNTIPALLGNAAETHDTTMTYCGLASPELHLRRVSARVARGGHDIPERKIRERWASSQINLIRLLPRLRRLQVFDNSAEVGLGAVIPAPVLLLKMASGRVIFPDPHDTTARAAMPDWAKPIVQAAFDLFTRGSEKP